MPSISRRALLQGASAIGALSSTARTVAHAPGAPPRIETPLPAWEAGAVATELMPDPIWVYDNWAAYTDGYYQKYQNLPDETRLTEQLALSQLRELVRLKRQGVHFDYYMMNAFWFDPAGGYRTWRAPDWPRGPDAWIEGCLRNDLKPGLWFGTNSLWKVDLAPAWKDSLAVGRGRFVDSMSMYEGGFFPHFMQTLQHWYDRGIRMFEFDTADFDAATPAATERDSAQTIRERNQTVFADALKEFRRKNPDALLVAFNGFGGDIHSTATPFPFKKPVDLRWLGVFDTLYSGDIRVSDVPQMNFWRSVDLFNDHMVRRYEQAAVPLERIDPFCTFTKTWFGYKREMRCWKSMLLRTIARGSWKKTIYGSLELLSDEDAKWMAKVQGLFGPLLASGRTKTFGGIPGETQPYGFGSFDVTGAVYTISNPTQETRALRLPRLSRSQPPLTFGRVMFRDAGFEAQLTSDAIILGPEQMSVVGFGRYADAKYDLGVEHDSIIPDSIRPIDVPFKQVSANVIEASVTPPPEGQLRVMFWQRAEDGTAPRSKAMKIEAQQAGRSLRVHQPQQELAVSTGISWGAAEIRDESIRATAPITIRCSTGDKDPRKLEASLYQVIYRTTPT
jgi:hypothetical protein